MPHAVAVFRLKPPTKSFPPSSSQVGIGTPINGDTQVTPASESEGEGGGEGAKGAAAGTGGGGGSGAAGVVLGGGGPGSLLPEGAPAKGVCSPPKETRDDLHT